LRADNGKNDRRCVMTEPITMKIFSDYV